MPERPRRDRPLLDAVFILLFVAALAGIGQYSGAMQRFDWAAYDFLLDLLPLRNADAPVIVAIDERSVDAIGPWPWPRSVYANALRELHKLGVARIGFDVLMTAPDAPDGKSVDDPNDIALAHAIASSGPVYMPVVIDETRNRGQLLEVLPAPALIAAGVHLGHVHLEANDDGVVRGVYLWQGIDQPHWPHLSLAMATDATPAQAPTVPATTSLANARADYKLLRFVAPAGGLPRVSFIDLVQGRVDRAVLRGKSVLIGMTAAAGADTIATPVTTAGRPMAGVEFNANLFAAIRSGGLLEPLSRTLNAWLCALFAALPMLVLPTLRPRNALLTNLGLAAVPLAVSFVGLAWLHTWFESMSAVAASLLAYPLWSWRRLDQTLRSVRGDIGLLQDATNRAQLSPDTAAGRAERRFMAALLPAHIGPGEELRVDGALDERAQRWLDSYRARTATPLDAPRDSFEVLTRGLETLHASIARQADALLASRGGLAGMRDGVLLLGSFGHLLFANDAAKGMLQGHTPGALGALDADADPLTLLAPIALTQPNDWRSLLRALYVEDRGETVEARSREGQELLVGLARVESGAVITLVDISRLRQAERAHRETLSFLSHDLRSPIVSLLALCGALRDRHANPDVQDTLGRIQRYAQRSLANAEQFLQLARIENEPVFQVYELDLLGVAENAAAQLSDLADSQGSRIEVLTDTDEGAWVIGNGEFIERAIVNLIGNALKYGPMGDTITLNVSASDDAQYYLCDVHDNGPGIPEAEQARLFDPYYQGPEHRNRREGVGLGLRFVQVVAQRHAGRVEVRSEPGRGTSFRLLLPRAPQDSTGMPSS